MVWLPDGEKFLNICSFVSTEYTNVTDRQTPRDGIDRTYAQHRAAKIVRFGCITVVQGHSRSLKLVLIETAYAISYQ